MDPIATPPGRFRLRAIPGVGEVRLALVPASEAPAERDEALLELEVGPDGLVYDAATAPAPSAGAPPVPETRRASRPGWEPGPIVQDEDLVRDFLAGIEAARRGEPPEGGPA